MSSCKKLNQVCLFSVGQNIISLKGPTFSSIGSAKETFSRRWKTEKESWQHSNRQFSTFLSNNAHSTLKPSLSAWAFLQNLSRIFSVPFKTLTHLQEPQPTLQATEEKDGSATFGARSLTRERLQKFSACIKEFWRMEFFLFLNPKHS